MNNKDPFCHGKGNLLEITWLNYDNSVKSFIKWTDSFLIPFISIEQVLPI